MDGKVKSCAHIQGTHIYLRAHDHWLFCGLDMRNVDEQKHTEGACMVRDVVEMKMRGKGDCGILSNTAKQNKHKSGAQCCIRIPESQNTSPW